MRPSIVILTGLLLLSSIAPTASGQDSENEVSWGLLGGRSFPTGGSGEYLEPGRYLGAFAELTWTWPWRAVRLEATLTEIGLPVAQMTDENGEPAGEFTSGWHVRGAMANLILRAVGEATVRSYFIGGLGVFRIHSYLEPLPNGPTQESEARTRVGLNAGLGVQASRGRLTLLAEGRYLVVLHAADQPELRMIPVSFGLRLRA